MGWVQIISGALFILSGIGNILIGVNTLKRDREKSAQTFNSGGVWVDTKTSSHPSSSGGAGGAGRVKGFAPIEEHYDAKGKRIYPCKDSSGDE